MYKTKKKIYTNFVIVVLIFFIFNRVVSKSVSSLKILGTENINLLCAGTHSPSER